MKTLIGFLVGNLFLAVIIAAAVGAFFVLYSAVQWLDLSDVAHKILGCVAVAASALAAAGVGWSIDRFILNPPFRAKR